MTFFHTVSPFVVGLIALLPVFGMALEVFSRSNDAARTAKLQGRQVVRKELTEAGFPLSLIVRITVPGLQDGDGHVIREPKEHELLASPTASAQNGRVMYNITGVFPIEDGAGNEHAVRFNGNAMLPVSCTEAKLLMLKAKELADKQKAADLLKASGITPEQAQAAETDEALSRDEVTA